MQSSPTSSGIRSRVRSVRSCACRSRSGEACSTDPTVLSTTTSSRSPRASSCSICPTFSRNVIRPSRSATRSRTGVCGSRYARVSGTTIPPEVDGGRQGPGQPRLAAGSAGWGPRGGAGGRPWDLDRSPPVVRSVLGPGAVVQARAVVEDGVLVEAVVVGRWSVRPPRRGTRGTRTSPWWDAAAGSPVARRSSQDGPGISSSSHTSIALPGTIRCGWPSSIAVSASVDPASISE